MQDMGIKCVTPKRAVDNFFRRSMEIMRSEILRAFSYLGEQAITKVRDREEIDSWYDHTGNLRSSIGYSVYDHGKSVIESAFAPIKGGTKGQSEGKKMVEELASKYASTYALVIVAAMNYAEYVEACNNKDVLASTEIWAKSEVEKYLKEAKERAIRRINKLRVI